MGPRDWSCRSGWKSNIPVTQIILWHRCLNNTVLWHLSTLYLSRIDLHQKINELYIYFLTHKATILMPSVSILNFLCHHISHDAFSVKVNLITHLSKSVWSLDSRVNIVHQHTKNNHITTIYKSLNFTLYRQK